MLKVKIITLHIFLGIIGTAFIARDQLTAYFGSIDLYSPRLILFKDGLKLMLSHFPFGTGYATFGSSIAVNYYSPLYVALKYPYNWGMSPSYSAFLSDLFWPTIFSQFGILGLILFLFIIIYFLKLSMRKMRLNKNAGFAMLRTIVYLLITSIAESVFLIQQHYYFLCCLQSMRKRCNPETFIIYQGEKQCLLAY